jgi:hypothetical protein
MNFKSVIILSKQNALEICFDLSYLAKFSFLSLDRLRITIKERISQPKII